MTTELKQTGTKKKRRRMFNFVSSAFDRVFTQVYDGEPVRNGRKRTDSKENVLEEEVLFCKNNICVHKYHKNEVHKPGYLCLKKIYRADTEISDLILSWIPNSLLAVGSTDEAEILEGEIPKIEDEIKDNADNFPKDVPGQTAEENTETHVAMVMLNNFETPLGEVFSVNLLNMKTVKLFYNNSDQETGEFVIGSPENEYKVFHFHMAGLVKVTEIFDQWNGCIIDTDIVAEEMGQQTYYIQPGLTPIGENGRELHPEERRYRAMKMTMWLSFVNQLGQIEDGFNFRKHVFFGGLSQEVRPDAWKFLLYFYPMHSSGKERELILKEKTVSYQDIHQKRLALSGEDYERFWKNVQFTVDKDVVRTDRSHPYYAGQDNPNIQKMRNILLNYAIYNPTMGYTQGMSDLVAPLLATLHSEVDSFWCFVGLMEASMFATTPTDQSMDRSLGYLRELLRIILPEFYMHCLCQDYDLNLLFAHRWLVLCFKREFIFPEVLKIWEACWSRYQTDYFHIFVCVALVSLYSDVCLQKKMDADEMLQYFTGMAMKFDGSAVLKEARFILYKFRLMNRIPCTLRGLLSGIGVWDGGISPEVECASNHTRCCMDHVKQEIDMAAEKEMSEERESFDVQQTSEIHCEPKEQVSEIQSEPTEKVLEIQSEHTEQVLEIRSEPTEMVITEMERSVESHDDAHSTGQGQSSPS